MRVDRHSEIVMDTLIAILHTPTRGDVATVFCPSYIGSMASSSSVSRTVPGCTGCETVNLPVTLTNVCRLKKYFTSRLSSKFVVKLSLTIPPGFKCLASLLCDYH